MSLRDEFDALQKSLFGTSNYELKKGDDGEYVSILFANEFKIFAAAYQSATNRERERALRIVREAHAEAQGVNVRLYVREIERRLRGDSNG